MATHDMKLLAEWSYDRAPMTGATPANTSS
jgi:hypothetical protein